MNNTLTAEADGAAASATPVIEERFVSSALWDTVVAIQTIAQQVDPDRSQFPPKLIFRPAGQDYELHLIQSDDPEKLAQQEPTFYNLPSSELVRDVYDLSIELGARPALTLRDIRVFPYRSRRTGRISAATVRLGSFIISPSMAPPESANAGNIEPDYLDAEAAGSKTQKSEQAGTDNGSAEADKLVHQEELIGVIHMPD